MYVVPSRDGAEIGNFKMGVAKLRALDSDLGQEPDIGDPLACCPKLPVVV